MSNPWQVEAFASGCTAAVFVTVLLSFVRVSVQVPVLVIVSMSDRTWRVDSACDNAVILTDAVVFSPGCVDGEWVSSVSVFGLSGTEDEFTESSFLDSPSCD